MKPLYKRIIFSCVTLLLAYPQLKAQVVAPTAEEKIQFHSANTPAHRLGAKWWKQRHDQKLEAAKTAKCDILFVGDSITQMWESHSGKLWKENYLSRNAFNIGYSGDQTSHVLWRLDNGEMDHFKPKVAVLMIGTNNARHHHKEGGPQQTADGVRAIIDRIQKKSPDTEILLLSVFPRGVNAQDRWRLVNDKVNAIISKYDDGDKVHYLDVSSAFLEANGNLSKMVMPDLLHPHAHGYKLWADAMESKLVELLKESKAPGAQHNTAVVPVMKLENDFYDWHQRHNDVKELIKKKPVDLIFIGDSITHMFGGEPKSRIARGVPTWNKFYGPRNAVNMGFGWDRTQNMLWRLQHGELDGVSPKVAVVLAGTNNLSGTNNAPTNTPAEIVEGVKAICKTIYSKSPNTKVLVLGVLPRQGGDFSQKVQHINALLLSLQNSQNITVLNMWDKFAQADGQPNMSYFQDAVHPNAKGYQLWAETMEPTLQKLLKD